MRAMVGFAVFFLTQFILLTENTILYSYFAAIDRKSQEQFKINDFQISFNESIDNRLWMAS